MDGCVTGCRGKPDELLQRPNIIVPECFFSMKLSHLLPINFECTDGFAISLKREEGMRRIRAAGSEK